MFFNKISLCAKTLDYSFILSQLGSHHSLSWLSSILCVTMPFLLVHFIFLLCSTPNTCPILVPHPIFTLMPNQLFQSSFSRIYPRKIQPCKTYILLKEIASIHWVAWLRIQPTSSWTILDIVHSLVYFQRIIRFQCNQRIKKSYYPLQSPISFHVMMIRLTGESIVVTVEWLHPIWCWAVTRGEKALFYSQNPLALWHDEQLLRFDL